jgi:hypothetical protein
MVQHEPPVQDVKDAQDPNDAEDTEPQPSLTPREVAPPAPSSHAPKSVKHSPNSLPNAGSSPHVVAPPSTPASRAPRVPVTGHNSEDRNGLILSGDLAFQKNAYDRALADYLQAYRLKPADSSVRRKLRTTLILLGRIQEAQKYR